MTNKKKGKKNDYFSLFSLFNGLSTFVKKKERTM